LPVANNKPVAEPSPTGKASSHPSYSIIGTSGIRKNELNADTKLAQKSDPVSING